MFAHSKRFVVRAVTLFSVGIIVSFIMSAIAGYVQDNTPAQYNVMGVTMPPLFYFVLAINAVVFLFGFGNAIAGAVMFFVESGAVHLDRKGELEPVVEQETVTFTAEETPAYNPDVVYDPQLALTR